MLNMEDRIFEVNRRGLIIRKYYKRYQTTVGPFTETYPYKCIIKNKKNLLFSGDDCEEQLEEYLKKLKP